ncbi:AAA family ATPase [Hymenobacter sp. 5317J-9]|uniref:ATP-dependent nuclease n=1 Tax=Hymenobacter sp. 5317J-9 TaxID=2932250 RepID=UPI001FD6FE4E|nr:AAA family ATPase [Hymenobacter sp. 5317J-9]UOQ99859.1 AAA family ATPase [Hymenobacter sp. 5317J-9]
MPQQEEVQRLIGNIKSAFAAGRFPNYIEYIRFPKYKNLLPDTKIQFDFPFTVFTGLNGTGKSSALHAIFGAPRGQSTGNYWFTTQVDPIHQDRKEPNCFIYGYKESGAIAEVLKTRINSKKHGPDYWEPSRPIAKYGMVKPADPALTRYPTIEKEVVYLDFRSELSAFDKYFYFGNFKISSTLNSKQAVLRKYSKYLKDAIDHESIVTVRNRRNKAPEALSATALTAISKILGKTYEECVLLSHNFYGGMEGLTAYFKTDAINYSEAYAGRGEFAVVKLVHEITEAENNSLVILDEPEVSLHPGAQIELKLYLLQQVLAKKLQVVISTHSSNFVEFLPNEAIKLFYSNDESKFVVKNSCNYLEAFSNIGIELDESRKSSILVEDKTARLILERVIDDLGADFSLAFNVRFLAGGSEMMYKTAAVYAQEGELKKFLMLDGDKRKPLFNPEDFTVAEAGNLPVLKAKLQTVTGVAFNNMGFRVDGNASGGNPTQQKAAVIQYLGFVYKNLGYLPGQIPEETIWDEEYVTKTLEANGYTVPTFDPSDYKDNILAFAELMFGDREESSNDSAKKLLIREFIRVKGEHYTNIVETLTKFKDATAA